MDESAQIRQAGAYGVGVAIEHAPQVMHPFSNEASKNLLQIIHTPIYIYVRVYVFPQFQIVIFYSGCIGCSGRRKWTSDR